jgi:hypothetical protein
LIWGLRDEVGTVGKLGDGWGGKLGLKGNVVSLRAIWWFGEKILLGEVTRAVFKSVQETIL